MRYRVYTDQVEEISTIHEETCRFVTNRKSNLRPDNWWHGPYARLTDAENKAQRMGTLVVGRCSVCTP